MYRILCSYPQPHVIKSNLPTLDEAREYWCERGLSGQTDDENYYWTEVSCVKHGWQPLTFYSMCQECDREADHSGELLEPITNEELVEIASYEREKFQAESWDNDDVHQDENCDDYVYYD